MGPFRSRWTRVPILFALGLAATYGIAVLWAPHLSTLCEGVIVGRPCRPVAIGTAWGYLVMALGLLTMIFGPIVGSLLELAIHGARWETSRVETAVSNVPILAGIVYLVLGVGIAAAAS